MTEQEICEKLYKFYKEGEAAFDSGTGNPYPAGTLRGFMHMLGWCYQDQRRAHMRHNPRYAAEQAYIERIFEEEQREEAVANGRFGAGA